MMNEETMLKGNMLKCKVLFPVRNHLLEAGFPRERRFWFCLLRRIFLPNSGAELAVLVIIFAFQMVCLLRDLLPFSLVLLGPCQVF